jgi:hypothetical protein
MSEVALLVVPATLLLLVALVLVARWRGDVAEVPRVLEEPPEPIHPALLAILWGSFRRSSPLLAGFIDRRTQRALYQAELLHLAQQGVLELQPVGPVSDPADVVVRQRRDPDPVDAGFVRFLFPRGERSRTLREIGDTPGAADLLGTWAWGLRSQAMADMVSTHLAAPPAGGSIAALMRWTTGGILPLARQTRGWPAWSAWAVGTLGAGVALSNPLPVPWVAVPPLVCLAAGYAAVRLMPYRVPAPFRVRLARWSAFRRFLTSGITMDEAPAAAVAVWERHLVYAAALQAADEVDDQVRHMAPARAVFFPWLGAGADALGLLRSMGALAPAPARRPSVSLLGPPAG